MRRLSPRLTAAVLWLALALLPLRVLGSAWMQVAPPSAPPVAAAQGDGHRAQHPGEGHGAHHGSHHAAPLAASAAAPAADPSALPPCHGHAAQGLTAAASPLLQAADAASAEPTPAAHHTCHLCDLCHAGVSVAPQPLPWAPAPAEQAVRPWTDADAGRLAADGLFRPPR